jgi:ubiquitin C-terminal hydrolase
MTLVYYFLLISVTVTVKLEAVTQFCQMFQVESKEDQTFFVPKIYDDLQSNISKADILTYSVKYGNADSELSR